MGWFQSKDEKRIRRDLEIRKAITQAKKLVERLGHDLDGYIDKARRARRMGDGRQLNFLKQAIRRTAMQRTNIERQILFMETSRQVRDQAEAFRGFASAMNAISASVAEAYREINMEKTQTAFETAVASTKTLEERVDLMMETSAAGMMDSTDGEAAAAGLSDGEIEAMIDDDAVHEEKEAFDAKIADGLAEVEKELEQGG